MNAPAVSVLMTAYNREKYIAAAIESVLAQTFTDFELIIVDDCSSDRTVEIARRYATDPRVRVHMNEKNLGDYPNRNRAAEHARGRYLKYLDSDDLMYPHCLAIMTQEMERFREAGIGFEGKPNHKWSRPFPFMLSPLEIYREHFLECGVLNEGPTGAIIKAEVFRKFGGFLSERYTSDTEFWLRVSRQKPLLMCCAGLTWWRQHTGQEMRSEISQSEVIAHRYRLDVSALTAEDCPLGAEERRLALKRIQRRYLRRMACAVAHRRCGALLALWKDLQS